MSTVAPPPAPTAPTEDRPPEQELVERGLVLVRARDDLDRIESSIIEARLSGEEAAEAYLYVIMPRCPDCRQERPPGKEPCPHCGAVPQKALSKPIVGPTVDFTRLVASMLNATGKAKLTPLRDQPPVVQDVQIGGRPYVRVLACVVDELTGIAKWALKEEARSGAHAATVALEKAEGKALASHPAFNRKLVHTKIREFLRRQGLNPKDFIIGGGGGAWASLFGRAKAAGLAPGAVRAAVREQGGVGLSEVHTREQAEVAAAAADAAIAQGARERRRTPGGKPPSDVATGEDAPRAATPAAPSPAPARSDGGSRGGRARSTARGSTADATPGWPTAAAEEPGGAGSTPAAAPSAPLTDVAQLRARILETAKHVGMTNADLAGLWREVGPDSGVMPELADYQRLFHVLHLCAAGIGLAEATRTARELYPKAAPTGTS